jgi:hypothetical protein
MSSHLHRVEVRVVGLFFCSERVVGLGLYVKSFGDFIDKMTFYN